MQGDEQRIISSISMITEEGAYRTLPQSRRQIEVFTLDEVLIFGKSTLFKTIKFDDSTCDGWHLYAVDFSLQCQIRNIPVRVYHANIIHLSGGTQDKTFYDCERKLVKKCRNHFSAIRYTCGWAYTNKVKYWFLRCYRKIRYGTEY